jgi:hypothetical protein
MPNWKKVIVSGSDASLNSLIVINGVTGSLLGTASWANNATSASRALQANTASYVQVAASSSYALSASYAIFAATASSADSFTVRNNAVVTGSFTVITGSLIEFQVLQNGVRIGNAGTDISTLTGSLNISSSTVAANLRGSGSAVFSIDGTSGRLFQVDDSLTGSLFSVNTAAGLPIIEAFSDNTVRIGQFGRQALFISQSAVGIGKENLLNGILDVSGSVNITGSLNVSGSITGSLFGTASWALNAATASFITGTVTSASYAATASILLGTVTSASYALSASYAMSASIAFNAVTASRALNANTASFATSAATATSASFATNAANTTSASYATFANTASSADNFNVRNTLTVTTIVAQTITSSTDFVTGSTRFGSIITNTHQFTGSVSITGSLAVIDGVINNLTASWANRAISTSIADNAVTASRALNANTASYVQVAASSSYALSASYALNASTATSASFATSAASSTSASIATNAVTASRALNANTSSFATFAITSSIADNAVTASRALNANTASFATSAANATSASIAANAVTASYALASIPNNQIVSGTVSAIIDVNPAQAFRITSGSSTFLTISSSGNVGIGTTAPSYKLEVNSANGSIAILGSGYTLNPIPMLIGQYTSTRGYIQVPNQGTFEIWNGGTGAIAEFKNNYQSIFNGNVGIGTTTPATLLHVSGTTGGVFEVDGAAAINALYVSASGNVGINTTSPSQKLHINSGSVFIVGGLASLATQAYTSSGRLIFNNDFTDVARGPNKITLWGEGGTPYGIGIHSATTAYYTGQDHRFYRMTGTATSSITELMVISGSGNVGIGTATPSAKLQVTFPANTTNHVFKSEAGDNLLALQTFSTTNRMQLLVGEYNGTSTPNIAAISDTNTGIQWAGTDVLKFVNNGSENVTINAVGNVGIGTTVPGAKLDVLGGIQAAIIRTSDASTLYTTYQVNSTTVVGYIGNGNGIVSAGGISNFGIRSEADLLFAAGGNAERARITSGGNVGIGTTTPSAKLDVSGSTVITGSLTVITGSNIEFQVLNTGVRIGNIITDVHTVTGSLGISGSVTATNFTGSLFGTSSWAQNAITASYVLSGAVSASYALSSSYAMSASIAFNAVSASLALNANTASFATSAATATSASFATSAANATSASIAANAVTASRALNANTASYIQNAASSSYALSASYTLNASTATSASFATNTANSTSASYATFAATASSADNFLVRGTLTAQTIVAQVITSSTDFVTGSTRFGTLLSNTHQFTGSVSITGSLIVNNTISATSEYRLNNLPYARVATLDSGGGFGGGYNFNWSNGNPIHDSTGGVSAYGYATDGTIRFYASASAPAGTAAQERLRITAAGNVGINTTTPAYRLDVVGNVRLTNSAAQLIIDNATHSELNYGASNYFRANGGSATIVGPIISLFNGVSEVLRVTGSNVGIGTTANINQKLVVQGTISAASTNGYTLNGIINGNQVLTGETSPRGVAGLTAVGAASSFVIKTDPLGRAFGTIGLVGAAYDASGGGRNVLGIYGYALQDAPSGNNTENKPIAGLFISELSSSAGSSSAFNGSLYGVYASGNSSAASSSAGSIYGISGIATGRSGDTTYGGYLSATGGTNNYGLIVANGTVGIGTATPTALLTLDSVEPRIRMNRSGVNHIIINHDGTTGVLRTESATPLDLGTNGSTKMTILSDGNVGIGTTVPSNRLEVNVSLDGAQRIAIFKNGFSTGYTSIAIDRPNTARYSFIEHTTAGTTDWYTGTGYNGGAGNSSYQISTGINLSDSKLVITTGGNVGIGTTAPSSRLAVSGSIQAYLADAQGTVSITVGEGATGATGNTIALETNTTTNTTRIYNSGTSTSLNIGSTGTTSDVSLSSVRDLYFKVNNAGDVFAGTTIMFISASGNVGIGTTAPYSKFTIYGAASTNTSQISIINSEGGHSIIRSGIAGQSNNGTSFIIADVNGANQNTAIVIGASGNVGIGTILPSAKLDVSGSTVITGSLTVITGSNIEFQVLNTGVRIGNLITDVHTVTGSLGISGSVTATNFTGSLFGTASWANNVISASYSTFAASASYALTASHALNGGGGAGGPSSGAAYTHTQASPSSTWTVPHNLNNLYPVVTVYDFSGNVVIPQNVSSSNANQTIITFSYGATGYATAVGAGIVSFTTASLATSASYAATASVLLGSITSASYALTASVVLGSITSASYAQTSSYSRNFTVGSTFVFDETLTDYASVPSSIAGSNNLFTQATGSYTSAFIKYTAASASNARAGEVIAVWNGGTTQFTDFSTVDVGTTTAVTASATIVTNNLQFNIQTNTSGWNIKSIITYI